MARYFYKITPTEGESVTTSAHNATISEGFESEWRIFFHHKQLPQQIIRHSTTTNRTINSQTDSTENNILDRIFFHEYYPGKERIDMIDKISLEILKILQEKARIPNVEVSRQVGLAPSAVLERVKKLEKMGVIDGYEINLNPELFDRRLISFIRVTTEPGKEQIVGDQLLQIPDTQEIHFISGGDCYLVKLRCKDNAALGDLLQNKIRNIDGVITTKSETVLSTVKESSRIPLPDSL